MFVQYTAVLFYDTARGRSRLASFGGVEIQLSLSVVVRIVPHEVPITCVLTPSGVGNIIILRPP